MEITIIRLGPDTPRVLPRGEAAGYWCDFQSEFGSGSAIFIPNSEVRANSFPAQVEVRLGQEGFSAFQALPSDPGLSFQLIPLPSPGDFSAVGKVISMVWLEDAGEYSVIEVLLGDTILSVSPESIGDLELEYGQWVSFHIHQLLLWEQPPAL